MNFASIPKKDFSGTFMKTLQMFDFVLSSLSSRGQRPRDLIVLFVFIFSSSLSAQEALPPLPVIAVEQAVAQGLPSVTVELEEQVALKNNDSFQARTLARDRIFLL